MFLRNLLSKLFYGRYGIDPLFYFLFAVYFVLVIVNAFVRSYVLQIIILALFLYSFFRVFSRNLEKRRRENEWFKRIWSTIKQKVRLCFRRLKEIRTHRYRKCPYCKAVLRLPKRVGTHKGTCPRCKKDFILRIRV